MTVVTGLSACALSSLLFGSMFVPVRNYPSGNGIFVQWLMSCAILLVGLFVHATQSFPTFEPFAMLGGMFWALANATAVPIMNQIGIGMGMLVWGTTNCVAGWATGRFGLFGIDATEPSSPWLNYLGLLLVVVGGVLFSMIRPVEQVHIDALERSPLMAAPNADLDDDLESDVVEARRRAVLESVAADEAARRRRHVTAVVTALVAGVFYGVTFVPVIYIQDHPSMYPHAPLDGLGFVFSHFMGIFATATCLMVGHVIFSCNNVFVRSDLVGPSLAAGAMWGIAQSAWFVANDHLSQAVSFPIISMVPGIIGALWSVFYFRDIIGRRNLRLLATAVVVTLSGAIFVGLSK